MNVRKGTNICKLGVITWLLKRTLNINLKFKLQHRVKYSNTIYYAKEYFTKYGCSGFKSQHVPFTM